MKWQIIEIGGRQLLSLAVFAALTRLLMPTDFGLLGMVIVYITFTSMFVDLGMTTALIQQNPLDPEHLDAAFWFNIVCAIALSSTTVILSGPISVVFQEPRLAPLISWASLSLVFSAAGGVHNALFVREMNFRRTAIRSLVATATGGFIGVTMALAGFGVWSLVAQHVTASAAGTATLWIASGWRPTTRFPISHFRDLVKTGSAVFGSTALWAVASRSDQFFIGRSLGSQTLGAYVVGAKLSDMARMALFQPVAAVALPAVISIQGDHARLRAAVYEAMRVIAAIAFPVFVGLLSVAPLAVPLFFGRHWTTSTTVLQLLSLLSLVNTLQALYHSLLIANSRPSMYIALNFLLAVGTVLACVIGVHFGVEWVVVGMIINTVVVGALMFAYLSRQFRLTVRGFWGPCLPPALASVAMASTLALLPLHEILISHLAAQVAIGAAVYAAILALLAPRTVQHLLHGAFSQVCIHHNTTFPPAGDASTPTE